MTKKSQYCYANKHQCCKSESNNYMTRDGKTIRDETETIAKQNEYK